MDLKNNNIRSLGTKASQRSLVDEYIRHSVTHKSTSPPMNKVAEEHDISSGSETESDEYSDGINDKQRNSCLPSLNTDICNGR